MSNRKDSGELHDQDDEIDLPDQTVKPKLPELKAGKNSDSDEGDNCGCGDVHESHSKK